MNMNVLFSSDDNYARHLGVAMYSLLSCNKEFETIHVYMIDNEISEENRQKLQLVSDGFENSVLHFISFDAWKNKLKLNMPWPLAISAYGRLFVGEMLPASVDRVLYLDCDMVINASLSELWNADLEGHLLGAVQDLVTPHIKTSIGLTAEDSYFNSGMLLIDLKKWRATSMDAKCMDFINAHQGCVIHHDQGVLNGVIRQDWKRLPLKYNLMTIHFMLRLARIQKYFKDYSPFYEQQEIDEAKQSPAILHFTPSFTTHPWVKHCKHPLKHIYLQISKATPWKNTKIEQDNSCWLQQLINYRYLYFPF